LDTTIEDYFARTDTPSTGSPVGTLMMRILKKYPDLSFDAARSEARRLLTKAAGRFTYSTARVLSPAERETQRLRLRGAFEKPSEAGLLPFTDVASAAQNPSKGVAA
jgi:hypothetical protein